MIRLDLSVKGSKKLGKLLLIFDLRFDIGWFIPIIALTSSFAKVGGPTLTGALGDKVPMPN